jgi:hypothetical protein
LRRHVSKSFGEENSIRITEWIKNNQLKYKNGTNYISVMQHDEEKQKTGIHPDINDR